MVIKCYNEYHDYILFFDIEFDHSKLIQFAGLLFKCIDEETYQLDETINQYITDKICYPFSEYTHISQNFLTNNGISLDDLKSSLTDELSVVNKGSFLVVSHGLKNDLKVLAENGINLSTFSDPITKKTTPIDGYCTFVNGRNILKRDNHMSLGDIATDAGYYPVSAHNAYQDA